MNKKNFILDNKKNESLVKKLPKTIHSINSPRQPKKENIQQYLKNNDKKYSKSSSKTKKQITRVFQNINKNKKLDNPSQNKQSSNNNQQNNSKIKTEIENTSSERYLNQNHKLGDISHYSLNTNNDRAAYLFDTDPNLEISKDISLYNMSIPSYMIDHPHLSSFKSNILTQEFTEDQFHQNTKPTDTNDDNESNYQCKTTQNNDSLIYQRLEMKNDSLKKELSSLQNQLNSSNTIIPSLIEKNNLLSKENIQLIKEKNDLEQRLNNLNLEFIRTKKNLLKEIDEKEQEMLSMKNNNNINKEKTNDEIISPDKQTQQENNDNTNQHLQENNIYTEIINKLHENNSQLEKQLLEITNQNETILESKSNVENELNSLKSTFATLLKDKDTVIDLANKNHEILNQKNIDLQNENNKLQKENISLLNSKEHIDKLYIDLQKEYNKILLQNKSLLKDNGNIIQNYNSLQNEHLKIKETLNNEISLLEETCITLKNELTQISNQNELNKNKLLEKEKTYIDQCTLLQNQLIETTNAFQINQEQMNSYQFNIEELLTKLNTCRTQEELFKEQINELQSQLNVLTASKTNNDENIAQLQLELLNANNKINELVQVNNSIEKNLQNELLEKDKEILINKDHIFQLETTNTELVNENDNLQNQIRTCNDKEKDHQQETNKLTVVIEQQQEQIDDLNTQIKNAKQVVKDFQLELQNKKNELEHYKQKCNCTQYQISFFDYTIISPYLSNIELQSLLKEEQIVNQTLNNQNKLLTIEKDNLINQLQQVQENFNTKLNYFQEENNELAEKINKTTTEHNHSYLQLQKIIDEKNDIIIKLNKFFETLKLLNTEKEDLLSISNDCVSNDYYNISKDLVHLVGLLSLYKDQNEEIYSLYLLCKKVMEENKIKFEELNKQNINLKLKLEEVSKIAELQKKNFENVQEKVEKQIKELENDIQRNKSFGSGIRNYGEFINLFSFAFESFKNKKDE